MLNHSLSGNPLPVAHEDNALIAQLAQSDRLDLLANAQDVPLTLSQVLWRPGEPLAHVYFPIQGFVSLVATVSVPTGLEVAMIGHESMLGVRRVSVNNAATALQRCEVIAYHRGQLRVLESCARAGGVRLLPQRPGALCGAVLPNPYLRRPPQMKESTGSSVPSRWP